MCINLFSKLEKINLKEYADNSNFELYTGIVLDKDKNAFKIISGSFRDKKDYYEKITKKGYVVRKVFEKKVWDWIENTAPDNLIAYLMYSTAFSKWRGNNILSKYYVQLLNDIPQLNRERIKGNPNTRGNYYQGKKESIMEDNQKQYYVNQELGDEYSDLIQKKKIYIYPVKDGERLEKYKNKPFETEISVFDTPDLAKKFDDPEFYRLIFKLVYVYKIDACDAFDIVMADNPKEVYRFQSRTLLNHYRQKNKNPYYRWGPKTRSINDLATLRNALKDSLKEIEADTSIPADSSEIKALEQQIESLSNLIQDLGNERFKSYDYLYSNEKDELKKLRAAQSNLSKNYKAMGLDYKQNLKLHAEIKDKIDNLFNIGLSRYKNSLEYKTQQNIDNKKQAYALSQDIKMSNPAFDGGAFNAHADKFDRRNAIKQDLLNALKKNGEKTFMDLSTEPKTKEQGDLSKVNLPDDENFINKNRNVFGTDLPKISELEKIDNEISNEYKISKENLDLLKNDIITKIENEKTNGKELDADSIKQVRLDIYNKFKENPSLYKKELTDYIDKKLKSVDQILTDINNDFIDKHKEDVKFYSDIDNNILSEVIYTVNKRNLSDLNSKLDILNNQTTYINALNEYYDNIINRIGEYKLKPINQLFIKTNNVPTDKFNIVYPKVLQNIKDLTKLNSTELYKEILKNSDQYLQLLNNEYDKIKDTDEDFDKKESNVNDGVSTMYRTQTIGGQPKDVFPTNKGLLPVGGLFMENNTHSELNQELFEDDVLKTDIREAMLKIADKFKESLDLPFEPVDIYFTGSNANYNYNDQSDIDLHLVYDYENAGVNAELLSKYLKEAKKDFNNLYDIKIKGFNVELGCENLNEPLVTTAIYSIKNNEWVKKPENSNVEMQDVDMNLYNKITNKIENLIQNKDSINIGKFWKSLGKLRKESLKLEGELGKGNALFKKLRNLGYLTRLKDAYYNNVSKELSLESLEDIF